jgi:HAMP domain-containing protein
MAVVTAATIALDKTTQQVDAGDPTGSVFGASTTSKIGFYGVATPVAQRAAGSNTALTTASTTTVSLAVLTEIQETLIALGLMPAT